MCRIQRHSSYTQTTHLDGECACGSLHRVCGVVICGEVCCCVVCVGVVAEERGVDCCLCALARWHDPKHTLLRRMTWFYPSLKPPQKGCQPYHHTSPAPIATSSQPLAHHALAATHTHRSICCCRPKRPNTPSTSKHSHSSSSTPKSAWPLPPNTSHVVAGRRIASPVTPDRRNSSTLRAAAAAALPQEGWTGNASWR